MATFIEDHIGSLSFVVNRRNAKAAPTVIGASGSTEDTSNKVIRTIGLASPVILNEADQKKLADLMTSIETLFKTQEGLV
jgi:hypothetical protein